MKCHLIVLDKSAGITTFGGDFKGYCNARKIIKEHAKFAIFKVGYDYVETRHFIIKVKPGYYSIPVGAIISTVPNLLTKVPL